MVQERPGPRTVESGGRGSDTEIELKLAGDLRALKVAFASPRLRSQSSGRARTRELDAIYYDTKDLRLRRGGLSFRVRRDGRRFEQT
jgi:triphosphatase